MKKAEAVLRDALAETGMVIPLTSSGRGGYVEFLCRQIPGQEAPWLSVVEGLLRWGDEKVAVKERLFIARRYLLKDGRMVFGWFLSIDMASSAKLQEVSEALAEHMTKLLSQAQEVVTPPPRPQAKAQAVPPTRVQTSSVQPAIRVIRRGVDDEGREFEETEMPLPHVPKDLNVPSKPIWSESHGRYVGGGKGAKFSGSGGR